MRLSKFSSTIDAKVWLWSSVIQHTVMLVLERGRGSGDNNVMINCFFSTIGGIIATTIPGVEMTRAKGNLHQIGRGRRDDGTGGSPVFVTEQRKTEELRRSGQILLTKEKPQSTFKIHFGEDKISESGVTLKGSLPKIYLCWQFEPGDLDSTEMQALGRVINILKVLEHDDDRLPLPVLPPNNLQFADSEVEKKPSIAAASEFRSQRPSPLFIDLTGDDDCKEVAKTLTPPHPQNEDLNTVSRKRSFASCDEGGDEGCERSEQTGFDQPSDYQKALDEQLANTRQNSKVTRSSTRMRGLGRVRDETSSRREFAEVDEVFQGPKWKTFDKRKRVQTILEQFHHLRGLFAEPHSDVKCTRVQASAAACNYMRTRGYCFNENFSVVGAIPGVEVGDTFRFKDELSMLVIHRAQQGGIDYISASKSDFKDKNGMGIPIAVSVVTSSHYQDDQWCGSTLIFTGQGGNGNNKYEQCRSKDQELVKGNLALKNSCDYGVPIRVTEGSSEEGRSQKHYMYLGLFDVREYYLETNTDGYKLWKFKLVKRSVDQE